MSVNLSDKQPLENREKREFDKVIKHYDAKQFRLGLQSCKKILSKVPNHGETLSMKALIVNAMGNHDEAMELAREGLKNNFHSATCWHVIGILEQRNRNYDKAVSAFKNALSKAPDNAAILRDYSAILNVLRRFDDYRDTRLTVINAKPQQNQAWIGFIMANHFAKDYDVALALIDTFRETLDKTTEDKRENVFNYDMSEVLVFTAVMMIKSKNFNGAIEFLEKNAERIRDKTFRLELLGELYIKEENWVKAEQVYTCLINRNSENAFYYKQLELVVLPTDIESKIKFYDIIGERYSRALLPQRIVLEILPANHGQFHDRLHRYIKAGILKGRPALFEDLKGLYDDPRKISILERVTLQVLNDKSLVPTAFPWSCFLIAQHYTHIGEYKLSIEYTNQGLAHTPTLIELLIIKAKTYKAVGMIENAITEILEAANMDTADRFLNCEACKYLIFNGKITEAQELLSKFVRETQDVKDHLRELQVVWFESLAAEACYENGDYGEALRHCELIKRIFFDMFEDQFDFVQYCLRRNNMTSFDQFISFEDEINGHEAYQVAAKISMKIFFELEGDEKKMQSCVVRAGKNEEDLELNKKEKKSEEDDGWGSKSKEKPINTVELLSTQVNLENIIEFTTSLESHLPNSILTHALSLKLYHYQNKTAQAIRSLKKGLAFLDIPSKHNGFFIGNAVAFLRDHKTTEALTDPTLFTFYENLKLPGPEKIISKLDKKDLKSLEDSGLDIEFSDIKNSDQDFYTLEKIKSKNAGLADGITDLLKKFHI